MGFDVYNRDDGWSNPSPIYLPEPSTKLADHDHTRRQGGVCEGSRVSARGPFLVFGQWFGGCTEERIEWRITKSLS
jgi:hypothetical protein